MQLNMMGAEELNTKLENTHELTKDTMLEKIVLITSAYFCIATEICFILNQRKKQNKNVQTSAVLSWIYQIWRTRTSLRKNIVKPTRRNHSTLGWCSYPRTAHLTNMCVRPTKRITWWQNLNLLKKKNKRPSCPKRINLTTVAQSCRLTYNLKNQINRAPRNQLKKSNCSKKSP